MKKLLVIFMLFCIGCLPATQQEVRELAMAVGTIVPAVREAVASESQETKDKIEIVLGQVEDINKEVATAEDPIDAIEKGWSVSKEWNPYYGYGVLGLAILRLFQKKKQTDTALQEVVLGVEAHKNGLGDLKNTLTSSESVETRKMVKKILS